MSVAVSYTVYQINNKVLSPGNGNGPVRLSFPSSQVITRDCINSPTRSLPTGVNVYTAIQLPNGVGGADLYYITELQSVVVTALNA